MKEEKLILIQEELTDLKEKRKNMNNAGWLMIFAMAVIVGSVGLMTGDTIYIGITLVICWVLVFLFFGMSDRYNKKYRNRLKSLENKEK